LPTKASQDQCAVDELGPAADPSSKRERVRAAYATMTAAGQRQRWRQQQREQRQPPPSHANGQRSGATSSAARSAQVDSADQVKGPPAERNVS
jgi:hypothetical protein